MLLPDNGFGQPCSADCAEHNARGCPGRSPFCVDDRYAALDFQIRKLQDAIDGLDESIAAVLPFGEQGMNLYEEAQRKAAKAIDALQSIRSLVDEANSLARPFRVRPEEDAA